MHPKAVQIIQPMVQDIFKIYYQKLRLAMQSQGDSSLLLQPVAEQELTNEFLLCQPCFNWSSLIYNKLQKTTIFHLYTQ